MLEARFGITSARAARAAPDIGVVGEAFRAARTAKVEMPADPLLHIDLAWP